MELKSLVMDNVQTVLSSRKNECSVKGTKNWKRNWYRHHTVLQNIFLTF